MTTRTKGLNDAMNRENRKSLFQRRNKAQKRLFTASFSPIVLQLNNYIVITYNKNGTMEQ